MNQPTGDPGLLRLPLVGSGHGSETLRVTRPPTDRPPAGADTPADRDPAAWLGMSPDQAPPAQPRRLPRPRITPVRAFLTIALVASSLVVAYGLIARDATQIPVLTAGVFISGIVLVMVALAGAWAAFSRAREGESGWALVYAVLGGLAAVVAAGAFATAIILTLALGK